MGLNEGYIYTKSNCIGCNRCISGCPVFGANVSVRTGGENRIEVDGEKCIHCGRCLSNCKHHARGFRDDTLLFMEDLAKGERISLLAAPSFFIIYGKKALSILNLLREKGVRLVYDVSFGADIATWAYLKYIEEHPEGGAIAPPCSVVVSYIRKYSEPLAKKLIPVYSPLLCLASYIRNYTDNADRLAFLGPCIAKKDEIAAEGLVAYNITFSHLLDALGDEAEADCELEYEDLITIPQFGAGRIYPVPGGLSDNIRLFVPSCATIREVHGTREVYRYLEELEDRIQAGQTLPFLVDCLNCTQGCLSGTAIGADHRYNDDIFFRLQEDRKPNPLIRTEDSPYLDILPLQERRSRLFERFQGLRMEDFMTDYRSGTYHKDRRSQISEIEESRLEEIFVSMHKLTEQSRMIDCYSCGYDSCREMAVAIANGCNSIENCVHYLKDANLKASLTDLRTGINNVNAFLQFVGRKIAEDRLPDYMGILFNIIDFKYVNQKYGHKYGDRLLVAYSHTVERLAGQDEIVCIYGGNSYAALIKKENLDRVIAKLSDLEIACPTPELSGGTVRLSARVAVYPPEASDTHPSVVMEKLSGTYGLMQRFGNNTVLYYDDRLRRQVMEEETVFNEIKPALENEEFLVYYQPKVDIRTRCLEGAEALIRWRHKGEIIPPFRFIPLCEQRGMIEELDFYVLERTCRDMEAWIQKGIRVVPVSVNFSKNHFSDERTAERINAVIERYHVPKKYIEIEFTESAYHDNEKQLIASIDKLHAYGIASSMDDFGTGYSSLSMLQGMDFDTLKLDRSFLTNTSFEEGRRRTVIGSIIRMAKALNMAIVSEGIETESELEYMKSLDCDIVQGYLFDKPLEHDEFEKRLVMKYYP